jgi:hypothetical protein
MSRPAVVVLVWAGFMMALTLLGWVVITPEGPETPLLLGGTAVLAAALAGWIALRRLGTPDPGGPRAFADVSLPTTWLAISVCLLAVSPELGLWLVLVGGGMTAIGVVAVARERRAQRRASERPGPREVEAP